MIRTSAAFQEHFEGLASRAFSALGEGQVLACELVAEDSQFIRFNAAKVRQAGQVQDATLRLKLFIRSADGIRDGESSISLTGEGVEDLGRVEAALQGLQRDVPLLPVDPYAVLPQNCGNLEQIEEGSLPGAAQVFDEILPSIQDVDLAGIYAGGSMVRGTANSLGQRQWFHAENYSLDYSLYTPMEKAVKSTFAGSRWNRSDWMRNLSESRSLLAAMERRPVRVPRGPHRAYLAPAAVSDLISMFSWGCIGERSIRKGESPLRFLRSGERMLSPHFSLCEDFSLGLVPRFNGEGDISPEKVELFRDGRLVGSMVHSRTGAEYGLPSNGATASEGLRSPAMAPGSLRREEIFERLGTGVFLSNLHYLNWSDPFEGRITGMTRYACIWVENGEAVGPIETMRWDDGIYRFFGSELEAVTDFRDLIAETGTYHHRQAGGMLMPGMLLKSMNFTL